jgi:hypothetical protein
VDDRYSVKRLLVLRKLTRTVADLLRGQLREYLATLGPLLRPRNVLGEHVQSPAKETVKGADAAFKELQGLYETACRAKPFNLPPELAAPVEIQTSVLEMTPLEYAHVAKTERESKTVGVTCPLKWVLTYSGFAPRRLAELLADKNRTGRELEQFLLHTLVLHVVLNRQAGVTRLLEALQFPVSSSRLPGFGELPFTCISAAVGTIRPPDDVLIESTEVSGMDAFEEVLNLDEVAGLRNPFKERLVELLRGHGEEVPAAQNVASD